MMNYVMCGIICFGLLTAIALFYRSVNRIEPEEDLAEEERFSLANLVDAVSDSIDDFLNTDVDNLNLDKKAQEYYEAKRDELQCEMDECADGASEPREYTMDYVNTELTETSHQSKRIRGFSAQKANFVVPFDSPDDLTPANKFHILLYLFAQQFGDRGLEKMIETYHLADPKIDEDGSIYYSVSGCDIDKIYHQIFVEQGRRLSDKQKLDLVCWFVYQARLGNGCIDAILYQDVDGISCGCSGVPVSEYGYYDTDEEWLEVFKNLPRHSFNSVWLYYKGKEVHLEFLGFESEEEFERVCNKIYKVGGKGQLSEAKGGMVVTRANGSRLSIARPSVSDSWVFYIRNFGSAKNKTVEEWISDYATECEKPVKLLRCIERGGLNYLVTGLPGTGKTTFFRGMLRFTPKCIAIRIKEITAELRPKPVYPDKNISCFQETETNTGQWIIDFLKKTNGVKVLFGEIANAQEGYQFAQMTQTGSSSTAGTHHGITAPDTIEDMSRKVMAIENLTKQEALETMLQSLNIDIHLAKDAYGHRFLERITAFVPANRIEVSKDEKTMWHQFVSHQINPKRVYACVDLLRFDRETRTYSFVGELPQHFLDRMELNMTEIDQKLLAELKAEMHVEVERNGGAALAY